MLILPDGMQEKIESAQQTLYNNAQPEARILAYHTPPPPHHEPTYWAAVAYIQGKAGISIYCNENFTFVYHWVTLHEYYPGPYWTCSVSFYDRATKTWSDLGGVIPPDNYEDNYWRFPYAIYGVSPDDFWLAHSRGASHWHDGAWDTHSFGGTPNNSVSVNDVTGIGTTVWLAVEEQGIFSWTPSAGFVEEVHYGAIHVVSVIAAPKNHVYAESSWNVGTLNHNLKGTWSQCPDGGPGVPGFPRSVSNDGRCFGTGGNQSDDWFIWLYNPFTNSYSRPWQGAPGATPGGIYAISATDYFYSIGGQIFHKDDDGVNVELTHIDASNGFWGQVRGSNKDNVWACHHNAGGTWDLYHKGPLGAEFFDLQYNSYWEEFPSTPLGVGKEWTCITALSDKQMWICNTVGQIYYYNGTSWVLQHDLDFVTNHWVLTGIAAFGPKDVYAIAHRPDGEVGEHLILHYDVHGWNGALQEAGPPLTWIWGSAGNDIWVTGEYGLLLHYNGTAWTVFRAQNAGAYAQHEIVRMAGCASDHIWFVGHGGRIFLWDGDTLSTTAYLYDADVDFDNVSVSSPWRPVISGNKSSTGRPVVLQNTQYGDVVWSEWPGLAPAGGGPVIPSPARGIFSWRAGGAFICSMGNKVLNASDSANPLDFQNIECEAPAINQFWVFPGNNIFAVGTCVDGTGIWKLHPPDVVQTDISDYLKSGTISLDLSDPVATFAVSFENAGEPLFSEQDASHSVLYLGSYLTVEFRAGNSAWFFLGKYYIDRASFKIPGDVSLDARNSIGKYLSDLPVPVDESYHTAPYKPFDWIEAILSGCGITSYVVCDDITTDLLLANEGVGFAFPLNTMALEAVKQLLSARPWWRIVEKYNGTVVVGPPPGSAQSPIESAFANNFPTVGRYTFTRGTDLFQREVTVDDREAYSQVCVQTEALSISGEEVMVGDGLLATGQLEHFPVVPDSETVYVDGVPLVRNTHYTIDYNTGTLDFSDIPSNSGVLHNREFLYGVNIYGPTQIEGYPFPTQDPNYPCSFRIDASNDNFVNENVTLFDNFSWTGAQRFYSAVWGESRGKKWYRYFSLYVKGTTGGVPHVSQIKLFRSWPNPPNPEGTGDDPFDPTMVAADDPTPNVISASSEEALNPAWHAFDGADDTYWAPEVGGSWWIKLDLGSQTLGAVGALVTADYEASIAVYEDVPLAVEFIVPSTKTLFETVPAATLPSDCRMIAKAIANQIGNAGKLETFAGPIRPQLIPGDAASEVVQGALGCITSVKHIIGKEGFHTEFNIDSGGRVGAPSLQDLIDRLIEKRNVTEAVRIYTDAQKDKEPI
jgi:hypothetical protein